MGVLLISSRSASLSGAVTKMRLKYLGSVVHEKSMSIRILCVQCTLFKHSEDFLIFRVKFEKTQVEVLLYCGMTLRIEIIVHSNSTKRIFVIISSVVSSSDQSR